MSMVDNYESTLRALCLFLVANAPAGAERDVVRLIRHLEDGTFPNYFHVEWRRERSSCQLYINIGKYGGERTEDAEGNTWATYDIETQVSWPAWGSDSVAVCQERLALMTEITRLAAEIERLIGAPICTMVETKVEREERLKKLNEKAASDRITNLIRANCKGLRVGQERCVEIGYGEADLMPIGRLGYTTHAPDGSERRYTTEVTSTRAFYFMRVA